MDRRNFMVASVAALVSVCSFETARPDSGGRTLAMGAPWPRDGKFHNRDQRGRFVGPRTLFICDEVQELGNGIA